MNRSLLAAVAFALMASVFAAAQLVPSRAASSCPALCDGEESHGERATGAVSESRSEGGDCDDADDWVFGPAPQVALPSAPRGGRSRGAWGYVSDAAQHVVTVDTPPPRGA